MIRKQKHISSLLLERYIAGDISPKEKQSLEMAMAADEGMAATVRELRRSDKEIVNRYPPELMLKRILERAAGSEASRTNPKRVRAFPVMAPVIAAAAGIAAVVVFIIFPLLNTPRTGTPLSDRIKGNSDAPAVTELRAYLKTNPQAALEDQALISAGNTIQLVYTVGTELSGDRYGVIFSIDGRGAVSLHYPYTPAGTTRLSAGKQIALEESYTLDDAPDYEMFFFVIAGTPIDTVTILRTAERLNFEYGTDPERAAELFKPYEVKSLILRKAETKK
ncbi:hypothetical protein LQZ19_16230 [Treponema primitia]|uniref:hypothetical protein n=1 Tax=Treponema primitia TaxID=88058 RepID=UPI00397F1C08